MTSISDGGIAWAAGRCGFGGLRVSLTALLGTRPHSTARWSTPWSIVIVLRVASAPTPAGPAPGPGAGRGGAGGGWLGGAGGPASWGGRRGAPPSRFGPPDPTHPSSTKSASVSVPASR